MSQQKRIPQLGRKLTHFLVTPLWIVGFAASQPLALAETLAVGDPSGEEIRIVPNGENTSADWGLDKIGEDLDDGNSVYTYPDTTHPVRVYLIDTAVANPGNWIGANPKLSLENTIVIGAASSSQFGHGTRMLSLIAGLQTGVAPGTPIKVRNYDVYPTGTTTSGKLVSAINDAVAHYQNSIPKIPSVICIASSAETPATSTSLESSIRSAVGQGLTVIVSAGNQYGIAASYIPAAYGTMEGVICVGASNFYDQKIPMSNSGAAVDILAPGENIEVMTEVGSYTEMTGTSAAAALVAGSALAELSMNGSLTPAEVEARLIAAATSSPSPGSPPVLRTTPIAAATIAYPDGQITSAPIPLACATFPSTETQSADAESEENIAPPEASDVLKVFHGVNDEFQAPCSIAVLPENEMEFTFPIDLSLLNPSDLFTLRNGYAWRIRRSGNLDAWEVPEGSLSKKTAADGTVWLTAKIPASGPSGFLRLEVVETP